jgi:diguanylate cyclase (GGDEF)-like protein
MSEQDAAGLLHANARVLHSRVSSITLKGVLFALFSILIATLMVSYYQQGDITLGGIIKAQSSNYGLWMLDMLPFIFGLWGQYSGSIIAYEAGALVFDQTRELREKADHFETMASYTVAHDALTELPNRLLFYERVDQAIQKACIQGQSLSILLIELTDFKDIHDTLGRNHSDTVINQVASTLQGIATESNFIARIDYNTFSLLLAGTADSNDAEWMAIRIIKALEQPFAVSEHKLTVNVNIGIVHYPDQGEDVDTLVQRADVAFLMAQQSNYGFAVYDPSFDQHTPRRLSLVSELRQGIEQGELELFYQAKISVETGSLYGAEALVRWRHPTHGLISPDEFIPLAESNRLIKPLTRYIMQQAFDQCARWHEQGHNLRISVNLTVRDLYDPELPEVVAGLVRSSGVKPDWIMFEITESSIMTDPERALKIIRRLSQMGFKFSIDDFGTGYSSLSYLKKLPLAELKIDRSFVKDLLVSENDVVIVKATISLAHNLGLQVTAEGVESADIMSRLKGFRCDIAQGYLINRPMSVTKFDIWINAMPLKPTVSTRPNKLNSPAA